MDNLSAPRLVWRAMEKPETKLVTPLTIAVDAVLVVVFFAYMYSVVSTHVPSKDHRMILFWGAACAACLTTVFWLALQMFRAVVHAQRRAEGG